MQTLTQWTPDSLLFTKERYRFLSASIKGYLGAYNFRYVG